LTLGILENNLLDVLMIRKTRILIADDQQDVLEALRLLLKSEGYEVQSAGSPAAAIKAIDGNDFA